MSHNDPFDRTDVVRSNDLMRLAATLDVPTPTKTPALWHWTSFLDSSPTSTLGPDGHPRSGGLIPDPPHPRRMFAGGRMSIVEPFPTDVPIRRRATVGPMVPKQGSRGPLALVTVSFEYLLDGRCIATEEQDLVYLPFATAEPRIAAREPGKPAVEASATSRGASTDGLTAIAEDDSESLSFTTSFTEPALFRFSSLTFNSHRIHYDRQYAIETEGHEDLVVHGPLLIVRLLDLVRQARGDTAISTLSFRAKAPTYVNRSVTFSAAITDRAAKLTARDERRVLMDADVQLR